MKKLSVHPLLIAFVLLITLNAGSTTSQKLEIDPKGYIVFCPCMGRFGNQMDQFLGVVEFAKGLERTLVLPHLIEYPETSIGGSVQIPFQTYFKVEPLASYTKVILMDDFMEHVAPKVWPKGKRTAFCYMARYESDGCNAKEGNPFGPYWDRFGIDFDADEFFGPLGYDPSFKDDKEKWLFKYPADKFPVLAFTGAPAAFPVQEKNVHLQKYLKWSDKIDQEAQSFIDKFKKSPDETFIGIHLRNGIDFKKACEYTKESKQNFFASPQCLGYRQENGEMSLELCAPSEKTIINQLGRAIKKLNAKYVYVATDNYDMIDKFEQKFKQVKFFKYNKSNPHVDLCILGKADHTIVNCVSTFSAFIKRHRDSEGKLTEFWGFQNGGKGNKNLDNEEL